MATFRFELNGRPSKEGKYVVYLRETINGKRRLIKTPVAVNRPSDFNTKTKRQKWVRGNSDESNKKNQALSQILENLKAKYVEGRRYAENRACEYSFDHEISVAAETESPYIYGSSADLNAEEQEVLEKLMSMDKARVEEILRKYKEGLGN